MLPKSGVLSRVSPELVVLAGCLIALLGFGPRASAGLFQVPMTSEFGWGRDIFGLAIAIQNLLWGIGQPFAGAVADRFGATRVLCTGALLYAVGLVVMAHATTPGMLHLGAGVLVGFGLAGCSFNLVIGAFGKLLPDSWRPLAFVLLPASPASAITFGGAIGFLWLSTVPPTSALVMLMFGTRYMGMLYGFAFFSHQVGGFLGVYLGGVLYEAYRSYDVVWWLSVALGLASAVINLPIEERPVERPVAPQPA